MNEEFNKPNNKHIIERIAKSLIKKDIIDNSKTIYPNELIGLILK